MSYIIQKNDTLSGIALKNNTSVAELMKLNPTITNADKIYAGASLNLSAPTSTTPSYTMVNSNNIRQQDQNNVMALDTAINSKSNAMNIANNSTPTMPNTATQVNNNGTTQNNPVQPPADINGAIKGYLGQGYSSQDIYTALGGAVDLGTIDSTKTKLFAEDGTLATSNSVAGEYRKKLAKLDTDWANTESQFTKLKAQMDNENQLAVNSIMATFGARRDQLKNSYESLRSSREKFGYQTGGFQYTGNQMQGLLSNDEQNYIMKLSQLDAEEKQLLLQASQAKTKNDWEYLSQTMTAYNKNQDQRKETLKTLLQVATDQNKQVATANSLQSLTTNQQNFVESSSMAWADEYNKLGDEVSKTNYLNKIAKESNLSPTVIKSAILTQGAKNTKTSLEEQKLKKDLAKPYYKPTTGGSGNGKITIDDIELDSGYFDANGFMTPEGFNSYITSAVSKGLKRADVIEYLFGSGLLYLGKGDATAKKYNLTPQEKKNLGI